MRRFAASLTLIISAQAFAGGTCTAYVPQGCRIMSSEFSTGGGDKIIQYLEVDCLMPDDSYVKYIDRVGSIGGFFGLGRVTQPNKIIFREWEKDRDELQVDC